MPRLNPLAALRVVFAMNALGIAVWFPRIPDVKADLGVDLLTLSICFFMLPLGTMAGFFVAPRVLARLGVKRVCSLGGPAFILLFVLPALAPSALALGLALFVVGLVVAPVEVAMNAKAAEIERVRGRRIMAGCHGAWSVGSMSGALIGGGAAALGLSFLAQQMLLAPLFALIAWRAALALPDDLPGDPAAVAGRPRLSLPQGALLAVCALPLGALMIEGAMMEWSALFLRGDVGLGPFAAGAVFSCFALAMATGRFLGDGLAERLGAGRVLVGSAALGTLGMFGFAMAGGLVPALVCALVLGLGVANIYPLAMSMAAEVPGRAPGDAIATVAFIGFTSFLVGPPLIGTVGSLLGLPVALALLTPLALYPLFMARGVLPVLARPRQA
ncbi:MFS transporter [Halovulum dunhuangense]|uniref:MFS transporter n=1 Tax=Halovulum dunhuangense TaxID=1505036 RepID=A0A849KXI1_9RHOB|nr:MFS transporter [Halovulum dunhuangense]NNU79277.1 MFS transporter [Halovulum dunhuangense]